MTLVLPRSGFAYASGDSLGAGWTAGFGGDPSNSWLNEYIAERDALYRSEGPPLRAAGAVADLYPSANRVLDRGDSLFVNGCVAGKAVNACSASELAGRTAATVFLQVGLNDVLGGNTLPVFTSQYTTCVDGFIATNAALVLVCVSILGMVGDANAAAINSFNGAIQSICAARVANCIYADVRTPLLAIDPTITVGLYVGSASPVDSQHLTKPLGRVSYWGWVRQSVSFAAPSPPVP